MSAPRWKSLRLSRWIGPVVLILIWELLTRLEILDPRFFVPFTAAAGAVIRLIVSGDIWEILAPTVRRVGIGFTIAALGGTFLGVAAGASRVFSLALRPIVDTLYPMPKISWLPLLLIFFGFGETAFVVIALATAFFQILIMVARALGDFPPLWLEAGRNFGADGYRYFTRVLIPGILPAWLQALRLGMVLALISVVVVEFVGTQSGLGNMVNLAWQQLQVERLFAGLLIAGLLGQIVSLVFAMLHRLLIPWQRDIKSTIATGA